MTLNAGAKLGPYEILAQIGAGGMGEVYRARDPRVGRDVAIKVSSEQFTDRFAREIHAVAALNHSNVCTLYDVGPNYLVMELIEGPTLADRIRQGPIPLEESLEIAKQIADALEAAHEKGIVHRDLKPGNIKLRPDGTVKVLDFGLAKVEEAATVSLETSPTLSVAQTAAGVLLGTAAYMSPEQARGKPVDKRADIWAFGAVFFEMLTGKLLFTGDTISDTLAATLKEEPDFEKVPAKVRPLLRSCLEKSPQKRLRDIGDAWRLLESAPETASGSGRVKKPWLAWSTAVLCLLIAGALALVYFHGKKTAVQSMRLQINLPDKVSLSGTGSFALSPDARHLAFTATGSDRVQRLWIRALDSLEARPLSGTESSGAGVIWSPDGRFIAFEADGKLKKIDVSGGPPQIICSASGNPVGGSWNRNGVIIFGDFQGSNGIMQVAAAGGIPSALTRPNRANGEQEHIFPVFLPDGRHFLYFCGSKIPDKNGLYAGSLDSKAEEQASKQILATSTTAVYVPSGDSDLGHLLFLRDRTLMAQQFDDKSLSLVGDPIPIAADVGSFWNFGFFSASTNGILVYRSGSMGEMSRITWLNRRGESLGTIGEPGLFSGLALSPDGSRAAVGWETGSSSASDIWLLDFLRDTRTRFTYEKSNDDFPIWSPDGRQIIFMSHRDEDVGNLYQKPASGTDEEKLLLKTSADKFPTSLTSDGKLLLYSEDDDLYVLSMQSGSKSIPFLKTEFEEIDGRFSPDMRWVAYASDETGSFEIYVRQFSSKGTLSEERSKLLISRGGGRGPRWRGDGKELYYLAPDGTVVAVQVAAEKIFQAGTPKPLFKVPVESLTPTAMFGFSNFDVAADGSRFLMAIPTSESLARPFTVILNWPALLKK